MTLQLGSLFSGIGGFDLAAERVGMTVAWQSEVEPYANRVLARRFAGVLNLGDVETITDPPPVDIITFGSPCQGFSVAGKRGGLADERSGLFGEAVRIIGRVRPALALWEAVPGTHSTTLGRDFLGALDALAGIGALDIAWRIVDSQYVGGCCLHGRPAVPQRRRRVFVVIDRVGFRAAEILALSEGGDGHPAPRRAQGQATATTLRSRSHGAGVNPPGRGGEDDDNLIVMRALTSPRSGAAGSCRLDDQENLIVASESGQGWWNEGIGALRAEGETRPSRPSTVVVPNTLTASTGHHGHSSPRGNGGDNLVTFVSENQRAELRLTDYARQLTTGGGKAGQGYAAALQGGGVRRLTPVECERLQGFPDGWTCLHDHPQPCDCPDGARYRCLGNAVVVDVAEWLLGRVSRVLASGQRDPYA